MGLPFLTEPRGVSREDEGGGVREGEVLRAEGEGVDSYLIW